MQNLPVTPLKTPLEIYEAATSIFPTAQIRKTENVPLKISLKLSVELPEITISTAIDKFQFLFKLQEVVIERLKAQAVYQPFVSPPIDPARFSVNIQLTDWVGYQRGMCFKNGKRCEDIIRSYLTNPTPEKHQELKDIELDPDQVEGIISEENLGFFERAIGGLSCDDPIVINFRLKYPQTLYKVASSIEKKKLSQPVESPYTRILRELQSRVVAQKNAVEAMASVLSQTQSGKNSSFLFVGPSGVGKTELAKAAAALRNNYLIRIDMQGYSESHTVSSFFGSPPGYIGSTSKPQLAIELEKYPDAVTRVDNSNVIVKSVVLLFDEFEKAHSEVRQSLLALFDEGYCTVRYTDERTNLNVKYTLKNSIIICTSNLCKDVVLLAFQNNSTTLQIVDAFKSQNKSLQALPYEKSFSDELLGRLNIIPFGPIPRGEPYQRLLKKSLSNLINTFKEECKCLGIDVENEPQVLSLLEEKLYGNGTDIRKTGFYFTNIYNLLDQNKHTWGDIGRVKITFFVQGDERALKFKITIFSPLFNGYIEAPGIPPYIVP